VEQILASIVVQPFDLAQARHHARIGPTWKLAVKW
jgi:hypothetical protein